MPNFIIISAATMIVVINVYSVHYIF